MAITLRGSVTTGGSSGCGTASVNATTPTGVVDGDGLILIVTAHNACCGTDTVVINTPSGWTPHPNNGAFGVTSYAAVFYRNALSQGASTTVTATGSGGGFNTTQMSYAFAAYSGVASVSFVEATNGQSNTSSTNATAPTVTTITNLDTVIATAHFLGSATFAAASGYTSRANSLSNGCSAAYSDQSSMAIGATGNIVNTLGSAKVTRCLTLALKPSGGVVVINSWYPVYNDQVRPNIRPKADFIYETVPPYVAPAFIPYALYSDQKRPNLRPQADFVFMAPQPLNLPTPWMPSYPNQVPFFKQQIPAGQAVEPVIPYFKDMRWQPQYSDQKRPNLRPQADFVFGPTLKLNFPMPWQAEYTDLQRPNLRPQADFVFEPPYTIATPLVTLPWLPIYSDQNRPNYRPQADFIFGPILPVVLTLPWLPYYPDLARTPAPVKGESVFEPPYRLNFPMPWIPQYADQVRPNLKVQRDFIFAPIFPLNLPMPWLPQYHVKQALLNTTWLGGAVYPVKFIPAARAFTQWFSMDGL